jgi:hypothetical protein
MTWKKCTEGRCNGIVRKHGSQGECLECGHAPPKAEPAPRCEQTLSMFGDEPAPTPPSNGTPTSDAAAASLTPETLREQHKKILRALYHAPDGLTDLELETVTGMGGSTVRPRRQELEREGWIEQRVEGKGVVTRETPSGRKAIVWFGSPRLVRFVQDYQAKIRGAA